MSYRHISAYSIETDAYDASLADSIAKQILRHRFHHAAKWPGRVPGIHGSIALQLGGALHQGAGDGRGQHLQGGGRNDNGPGVVA